MSFSKKVVIVTGASSGIGAAVAIAFAKEGANVVIVGRNEAKLKNVTEQCAKTGNEPLSVRADVAKDEDARRIIRETIAKFGKIDVLVNNAGILRYGGILKEDIMQIYDEVMDTNFRAQVHISHLAVQHLIKTKGNIVNVSSVAGKMSSKTPVYACYASSKAALDHFTRTVAVELGPHGVRVNTVSPGPVKTDIFSNASLDKEMEDVKEVCILGRVSESEEVSDLILYLASDKAVAITGADFVIDNGMML